MEIETYINLTKLYFKAWNNMDLKALGDLFADNCSLRDWEISAQGKEDVLAVNKKIFDSVESIKAEILNLHESNRKRNSYPVYGSVVTAELEIIVNGEERLLVTDIIEFEKRKIKAIRAYKGN